MATKPTATLSDMGQPTEWAFLQMAPPGFWDQQLDFHGSVIDIEGGLLDTFMSPGLRSRRVEANVGTGTSNVSSMEQYRRARAARPIGWADTLERIIQEIGRLPDNWDGPGSITPSDKMVRDVENVLQALPAQTVEPELEVDSSDGSVTVRWISADFSRSFALSFAGNARVTLVGSALGGLPPVTINCSTREETRVLDFLEDSGFKDIVVAQ